MKRQSIIQGFPIYVALLIFVVLTSGCVGLPVRTYEGDKLPKSEVAVIKGFCLFLLAGYWCNDVYQIDGNMPKATNVEVLPGWHELLIRSHGAVGFEDQNIILSVGFNAEAGHEYKIKPRFKSIDIIDVTTGSTILSEPCCK